MHPRFSLEGGVGRTRSQDSVAGTGVLVELCVGVNALMDISVWDAGSATASLQKVKRVLLEPGPEELVLEVPHCGLCHSDLSVIDNSWGISHYPLVPCHEVVGRVVSVGPGVDSAVIGQIPGLGWISGSCFRCNQCLE